MIIPICSPLRANLNNGSKIIGDTIYMNSANLPEAYMLQVASLSYPSLPHIDPSIHGVHIKPVGTTKLWLHFWTK
jgi:hypothetical protein